MSAKKVVRVQCYLPENIAAALQELADARGVHVSQLTREMVSIALLNITTKKPTGITQKTTVYELLPDKVRDALDKLADALK